MLRVRGRVQRAVIFFVWAISAAVSVSAQAALSPALLLVDDRGKAIEKPLDLCFQIELRSECSRLASGEGAHLPPAFYSLHVEGEDHGPLTLRREELKPGGDGSYQIAVPRRAWLRVDTGALRQPLTISLYSPQDAAFRQPVFRRSLAADERDMKIPAGEFLVSLAMLRNAPDLHRLKAEPAARVRLAYTPREGWSLLVRYRAAATHHPVSQVQVKASEVLGYGQREHQIAEAASGTDGLALLSGLKVTMASISAHHPEFIPSDVQGITASPGAFAFREVDLALGGHLVARVTVHGKPLLGAKCEVYALAPDAADPKEPYQRLWAGSVDNRGLCRSDRLSQGVYKLRVVIPDSTSQVNRWVSVPEAQDKEEDIALTPTRLSGEIRRGRQPAPGYSVETFLIGANLPKGARGDVAARATGDEAGKYELTLWTPGRYGLVLRSPSGGVAAGSKELTTLGDEDRKLDFDLDRGSLRGVVVNEAGRPVEKAWVALRWWAGALTAVADEVGTFEIDVQGEGAATLTAGKPGYRSSDPMEIQVSQDAPTEPVRLVLKKKSTVSGKVLSATGSPVASSWVASIDAGTLETGPRLYNTALTEADGTFEVEAPPSPARVFVSGPGCPLSPFNLPSPASPGDAEASALLVLRCPELPAALELTLVDDKGNPLPHAGVILLREGAIVPQHVLSNHLRLLGLPSESDGTGHLILAGLAPGGYELFLNTLSSESTIAAGSRQGFLTSLSLGALETTELQLTLPQSP